MVETKCQPHVVRRIEIWVPHNNREIAFTSPAFGPGNYRDVGASILKKNQKVPTGDYTASLLHSAYCNNYVANEPEFINVKEIMKNRWLWVYDIKLWTENGVYNVQDEKAKGRNKQLNIKKLEKMLEGGRELSFGGIRFSKDGKVRFAPKGSYSLGYHTPEYFIKDGVIIISYGQEGAEKLEEVSAKFKRQPFIYGVQVQEGQAPEQRVSAVDVVDDGSDRLNFDGNDWSDYYSGCAFGVLDESAEGALQNSK